MKKGTLIIFMFFISCFTFADKIVLEKISKDVIYDGALKSGAPSGRGKCYYQGVLFIEANFRDGVPDGEIKLYLGEGNLLFEGNMYSGDYSGACKAYTNKNLTYDGNFDKNLTENGKVLSVVRRNPFYKDRRTEEPAVRREAR
jgi:hypothetical protein